MPTSECIEFRQSVEKILNVPSVLKHGIDFDKYLVKTEITQGDMVNTKFVVDKSLYADIAKMMYPAGFFDGMSDIETELFLRHMYNSVIKFKAMIYNYCKNEWIVLYNDIQLKLDMRVNDIFFFGRNEKEAILEHLNDTINVSGLDYVIMTSPIQFTAERVTDKLPYGTLVRWTAVLPANIMNIGVTYSYFESHAITVFDMFYGYQIMAKIQAALETEILTNHKPAKGDILITPEKAYTLNLNNGMRCLQWFEN